MHKLENPSIKTLGFSVYLFIENYFESTKGK